MWLSCKTIQAQHVYIFNTLINTHDFPFARPLKVSSEHPDFMMMASEHAQNTWQLHVSSLPVSLCGHVFLSDCVMSALVAADVENVISLYLKQAIKADSSGRLQRSFGAFQ